jgi:hypothetical protein
MDELVGRIAAAVGITPETAEAAVRVILAFLHTDGPADRVEALARQMGAEEALRTVEAPKRGGLLGMIGGLTGGGGAMAAFSALSALGLDMDQIQRLVQAFVDHAREKADPATVDEVIAAIPGLDRLL